MQVPRVFSVQIEPKPLYHILGCRDCLTHDNSIILEITLSEPGARANDMTRS